MKSTQRNIKVEPCNARSLVSIRVSGTRLMCLLTLLYLPIGLVIGSDISIDGQVSADTFSGDGSLLTNIPAGPPGEQGPIGPQGPDRDGEICVLYQTLIDAGTMVPLPTFCVMYSLGGTGPAGGLVFHASNGGFSGLEAATADLPGTYEWGCIGTAILGADGTSVGTGAKNTMDIVAGCATRPIAASAAADYSQGGFTDYFLPSKDELNLMYVNLRFQGLGGFANDFYWSSSEVDDNLAWIRNFLNGDVSAGGKSFPVALVRAVRDF